jgi:hypothetical protein
MEPRIIIALLALLPFAAWSQPKPPTGLAVEDPKGNVATPQGDAVQGPKGNVAAGLKDAAANGTIELTPALCPPELQGRNATAGAVNVTAGFDAMPFVRAEFPNGEVRVVMPLETRIWHVDGTKWSCRAQTFALQETPAGTPPDLPQDPMQGRRWLERHNSNLHDLISLFARGDENVLAAIDAEERRMAGSDLFKQMTFRTGVVKAYIKSGL